MTPREIVFAQRGFQWRQEQEQWRIASIVAAIYDVQRNPKKRRKPITAKDFMPRERTHGATTAESQKAILDGLVARTRHMPRLTASSRLRRHPVASSGPQ